ncbi:pyrroloquinoline quinone precursor peptide PqqA [Roseomonas populi]|uniref:Coenzyme PQQ synthesis protein A n=1 Tax=Roseomonas populi TaxID=3121582 RepID=A0ABT1XAP2_9PROT|nr:pyrroloquinoline quinone precursor peptide PqqA [Roseomonas pecuniae]MCR0985167.1 pyrroloquinoline quinone precursor peptide PqqA [Roseomonas pecuniae]
MAERLIDAGNAIVRNIGVAKRQPKGGTDMAWKTPKIVEISVAMEINSYACAEV